MIIGVPKELKAHEYRVGLTPETVMRLVEHGHVVLVERDAGVAIGIENKAYASSGATIVDDHDSVFDQADMIVKVKEPELSECRLLRPGQILFAYLHLAALPEHTKLLLASAASCIAYETVTDEHGHLPLLAPMSEIAGKLSVLAGARFLEQSQGGCGVLISGASNVAPASVVIIGGGVVGENAARMAIGLGANVTIVDKSQARLDQLTEVYGDQLSTLLSSQENICDSLKQADIVIGAVLVPGASAPKLVSREMLALMKKGTVLVDVAIDQGGCFETSKPTSYEDPTYVIDGVIHYCVTNMPGVVSRTSTLALAKATEPYILRLAELGLEEALRSDRGLLAGLSVHDGNITQVGVAQALGYDYVGVNL